MLSEVIARTQRLRLFYCSCVGFGRRSFHLPNLAPGHLPLVTSTPTS